MRLDGRVVGTLPARGCRARTVVQCLVATTPPSDCSVLPLRVWLRLLARRSSWNDGFANWALVAAGWCGCWLVRVLHLSVTRYALSPCTKNRLLVLRSYPTEILSNSTSLRLTQVAGHGTIRCEITLLRMGPAIGLTEGCFWGRYIVVPIVVHSPTQPTAPLCLSLCSLSACTCRYLICTQRPSSRSFRRRYSSAAARPRGPIGNSGPNS